MSQTDTNFLVVKFVSFPKFFDKFSYRCIHRSWIVFRDGRNVFVACPLQNVVSLRTHQMNVSEVYPATMEYETDDINDGIRFIQERLDEHLQKELPAMCEGVTSALQCILEVLPHK